MAKDNISEAKLRMTSLWKKAFESSFDVNLPTSRLSAKAYKKGSSLIKKSFIDSEFVMVEPTLLPSLNAREQKLAIKIMSELKMNNVLWYYDYRKLQGRDERAILSLRKKQILFKTELNEIHIINPWFIRKGSIERVIVATYDLLFKNKGITKKMIKHLDEPNDVELDMYYSILAD